MKVGEEILIFTVKSLLAENIIITGTETNPIINEELSKIYVQQSLNHNFLN